MLTEVVPPGQIEHVPEPAAEYNPATQLKQLVANVVPNTARYFPAVQLTQLVDPLTVW